MQRSLAQQVEHWVKLGVGLEHAKGVSVDDVRAASLQYRHARDEAAVRSGRRSAASLHAIPVSLIKKSKITIPPDAFANGRKSW